MGFVTCHRWFPLTPGSRGPQPPRPVLDAMLKELDGFLLQTHSRPVRLETETWQRPPTVEPTERNDACVRIRIEVKPGFSEQPLRGWYEWQHPKWEWSRHPFPDAITRADAARTEMDAGE